MKKPKVCALLPMKAISERVPNKNLKLFNGNPLFSYVLKILIQSNLIDKVIINTDSKKIINVIENDFNHHKIQINLRPKSICGNYVSMNKIINYDIKNEDADFFIQTHSTNPLLSPSTLEKVINKMHEIINSNLYDSIFSVTKIQKRFYDEFGNPYNHDPKMLVTQHLKPLFEENSCFYLFTKSSFLKNDFNRIGKNPLMYEIGKIESLDIDENDDFIIAEKLYKYFKNKL